jgi:hypothetical protein
MPSPRDESPPCRKSRPDYPDGVIGIYDNNGSTCDRYTVVYTPFRSGDAWHYPTLTMSADPFHPLGVGMHGEYSFRPKRMRGERVIGWSDLPVLCQQCVRQDLEVSDEGVGSV